MCAFYMYSVCISIDTRLWYIRIRASSPGERRSYEKVCSVVSGRVSEAHLAVSHPCNNRMAMFVERDWL